MLLPQMSNSGKNFSKKALMSFNAYRGPRQKGLAETSSG